MTQLATLIVPIKGDNTHLMQSIAQAKAALQGISSPTITPRVNLNSLNATFNAAATNFGTQLQAQINQLKFPTAGGVGRGGGTSSGFFGSQSVFGASTRDIFRDAGAIFIIDRAAKAIKDFSDTATSDLAKVRQGLLTTGEAMEDAFSKVPAVGTSFAAGRSIRGLIEENMNPGNKVLGALGFKAGRNVDEINSETADIDTVTKALMASAVRVRADRAKYADEHMKSIEQTNALSLQGPLREAVQLRNNRDDALRAIEVESRARIDARNKETQAAYGPLALKRNEVLARGGNADRLSGEINTIRNASIAEEGQQLAAEAQKRIDIERNYQDRLTATMVDGSKKRQLFLGLQGGALSRFSTGSSVNEYALAAADREIALQEKLYDIHQKIAALDKDRDATAIATLNAEIGGATQLHQQQENLIRARVIYQTQVGVNSIAARNAIESQFGNVMGIGGTHAKDEALRKAAFDTATVQTKKEMEDLQAKIISETPNGANFQDNPDFKVLQMKKAILDAMQREYDLAKGIRNEDAARASVLEKRDLQTSIISTQASVMQSLGNSFGARILSIKQSFGNQIDDAKYQLDHAKTEEDKSIAQKRISALGIQSDIAQYQAGLESGGYTSHAATSQRSLTGIKDNSAMLASIANKLDNLIRIGATLTGTN